MRELWNVGTLLNFRDFVKYAFAVIYSFPDVIETRSFAPVDAEMKGNECCFRFPGNKIISLDGGAIGGVREIVGRKVYDDDPLGSISAGDKVVDLGANQGIFSLYAACQGADVVAVEGQKGLVGLLMQNVARNGYVQRVVPVWALVGSREGAFADREEREASSHWAGDPPHLSMRRLLEEHAFSPVDFLKVDIEGSEFALFSGGEDSLSWLEEVRRVAMEVHTAYGDPQTIAGCLEEQGFEVSKSRSDETFSRHGTLFVHAWRTS